MRFKHKDVTHYINTDAIAAISVRKALVPIGTGLTRCYIPYDDGDDWEVYIQYNGGGHNTFTFVTEQEATEFLEKLKPPKNPWNYRNFVE